MLASNINVVLRFSQHNISQSITLPLPPSFVSPLSARQVRVADGHVPIVSAFESATRVNPCNNATNCTYFNTFPELCAVAQMLGWITQPHMRHWFVLGPRINCQIYQKMDMEWNDLERQSLGDTRTKMSEAWRNLSVHFSPCRCKSGRGGKKRLKWWVALWQNIMREICGEMKLLH